MTNRKSLAIVIPMLFAASSSVNALDIFNKNGNKLELYGSINPNHEFSHGFLSTKIISHDDNTNSILGLSGEVNITDELLSYATIEYGTNFSTSEDLSKTQQSNSVRLGYAGFKYGDWGSIDYGRNYAVFHDVASLTNHMPYITENKYNIFTNNDRYMIGRNNSLLTYRNNNFFGLVDGVSFALQYQDKDKNKIINENNVPSWGASLKYESNVGLTAIGSCFSSVKSQDINNKDEKIDSIGAYGLGFKYDANDIYIAAFYGEGHNLKPFNVNVASNPSLEQPYVDKIQNVEAIAEYNFHSGFHPSLSYLDSKGQNSKKELSNKNDLELAKEINISTRYEFNKNISTYMNYKINLLKNNNTNKDTPIVTDNVIGAGIVYQF